MSFSVSASRVDAELVVKKSRFIAHVLPIEDRAGALAGVEELRRRYPDARHHCWAYLLGDPADAANAGMNDDGEPAGTAGRPILNAISHAGLGDTLVVVVRYFGGVKLGAGGLVRAYGAAARQALDATPRRQVVPGVTLCLHVDFAREQALRHLLQQLDGQIVDVYYTSDVVMTASIPTVALPAFQERCGDLRVTVGEQDHVD